MKILKFCLILICSMIILSCMRISHSQRSAQEEPLATRRLAQLEQLQRSMAKVICSAYYENYYYLKPKSEKQQADLGKLLYKTQLTTNSVSGSALILQRNPSNILLLSAYHIFDFPDTVKTYYKNERGENTPFVRSISVKYEQRIYITHKDNTRSFGHLISSDLSNDLALLKAQSAENELLETPFAARFATDHDLKFGKEAYLVGYPKGFLFIATGLISPSPYPNKFMVSAPFNRGFSGGMVVAFEEGKDSFVYLGMANSMAYDYQFVLVPDETLPELDNYRDFPYDKYAYVKELKMMNYGLTFAVKASVIAKFVKKERARIRRHGFGMPYGL